MALGSVRAQEVTVESIRAIVNDQVISQYDVDQRLNLILAAAGREVTPDQRNMLRQQALQNLVDEKLELQEAKHYDLVISDDEVNQAIGNIAAQYKMTQEQFEDYLKRAGASIDSLRDQVRAEIAWSRLVHGRLNPQVAVSDEEVQKVLDRLKENAGQNEYLVSEIFLLVDTPSKDAKVHQAAERLVEQLRQGAPFNVMARQFSEAATAAVGGDLGWVPQGQLTDEVDKTLAKMRPRTVSDPVRTPGGYYILLLRDRRKIMKADPLDVQLKLTQLTFDFPENADSKAKSAERDKIASAVASISGCDDLDAKAKTLGASAVDPVGDVRIGDMPAQLQAAVEPLGVGEASPPVMTDKGLQVLVVCGRNQPEVQMPTFDSVEESLRQQRLAMMARRYLRDLRRDAIVDYR